MGERNVHLHGNSFNRRAIGTEYETLACEYLTRHGYQILCRNFRCRQGEIDIIARRVIIFPRTRRAGLMWWRCLAVT